MYIFLNFFIKSGTFVLVDQYPHSRLIELTNEAKAVITWAVFRTNFFFGSSRVTLFLETPGAIGIYLDPPSTTVPIIQIQVNDFRKLVQFVERNSTFKYTATLTGTYNLARKF